MPHRCVLGDGIWDVPSLWEEARRQKLEPFEVNPKILDLSLWPWPDIKSISSVIDVIKDIEDADLKYPIILSKTGAIMDGFHRVAKARWQGKKLMAVQFEEDPAPSQRKED